MSEHADREAAIERAQYEQTPHKPRPAIDRAKLEEAMHWLLDRSKPSAECVQFVPILEQAVRAHLATLPRTKMVEVWRVEFCDEDAEPCVTVCGDKVIAVARALLPTIATLRSLAVVRSVRLAYGGGTVPGGGFCQLCQAEWSLFDINNKPLDEKEHHAATCLLAGTEQAAEASKARDQIAPPQP